MAQITHKNTTGKTSETQSLPARAVAPESSKGFNYKRLMYFVDILIEGRSKDQIELDSLIETYTELTKFFAMFGTTLEYASSDLIEKRDALIANKKTLLEQGVITQDSSASKYLEEFVKVEIAHGLEFANGENNNSILSGKNIKPWMKTYKSTTFVSTRGQWFFEYIGQLVTYID